MTQATEGVVEEDEEEPSGGLKAAQAALDAFEPQMEDPEVRLHIFGMRAKCCDFEASSK